MLKIYRIRQDRARYTGFPKRSWVLSPEGLSAYGNGNRAETMRVTSECNTLGDLLPLMGGK